MRITFEQVLDSIPERVRLKLMPVVYRPGELIIEKGAPVTCGYIFTEGILDVQSVNTRGEAYTYVTNYEPRFVGLMEIYSFHERYCCSLRVNCTCRGFRILREDLFDLLQSCDVFKQYLICYWANQFYESSVNESRYPINTTRTKLIDHLLRLCSIEDHDAYPIVLRIRREELAEFVGCSRRTIYRLMKELKAEGLFSTIGNALCFTESQIRGLEEKREE